MTDLKLHVDAGKCVRCGACIRDCAPRILEFGVDGFPRLVAGGEERCTRCQHCLAICPEGALSILGRAPEASAPISDVVWLCPDVVLLLWNLFVALAMKPTVMFFNPLFLCMSKFIVTP